MKTRMLTALCTALILAVPVSAAADQPIPDALKIQSESAQMAQSSCPSGLKACAPGSYGPGGCYKPGFGTCTAGLVCTGGTVACKPSNGAPAYCYAPNTGNCK